MCAHVCVCMGVCMRVCEMNREREAPCCPSSLFSPAFVCECVHVCMCVSVCVCVFECVCVCVKYV